jgi:site-specific DNA-methyltransferase (adenine-specific)
VDRQGAADQEITDREIRVGAQRLIHGDCRDVLPTLPAESVDVVVTSPPYNLGIAYQRHCDVHQ